MEECIYFGDDIKTNVYWEVVKKTISKKCVYKRHDQTTRGYTYVRVDVKTLSTGDNNHFHKKCALTKNMTMPCKVAYMFV